MNPLLLPPEAMANLEAFTQAMLAPDAELILLGDGSGTVADRPAGWACTAYDRRRQQACLYVGALSSGTNNFAELFPYVQALSAYHQQPDLRLPVRVQLVSDSEVTVCCGNGRYARRANGCWWAAVDWFVQQGYQLQWQHLPRNRTPWHRLADYLAGHLRLQLANGLPSILTHAGETLLATGA